MELHLAGKRAFVSGSTQGIGYAIARALLDEGVEVVINGRDATRVSAAAEKLATEVAGGRVTGIAADFADPVQVAALLQELGDVDILVNNVGVFGIADFSDVTDEDWQHYFTVNIMSGVRLSRQLLPGMVSRGWGRIVFINSESGVNVPADMIHYGASKAAMLALANGLAKLTRGTEVTVNSVLGGPTYSDGVAQTVTQIAGAQGMAEGDLKAAIIGGNATSILRRFIEPTEVASLALYLASPLSSATNGAALRADGGVLTAML
jgi:NAD(P)-dependent dehydrogenase (short-subunit alcohol dehydrogenase family)